MAKIPPAAAPVFWEAVLDVWGEGINPGRVLGCSAHPLTIGPGSSKWGSEVTLLLLAL